MQKNFECIKCNYKTDKKGNYKRHLKTKKHIELHKEFICDECKYKTSKKSNLIRHYKNSHNRFIDNEEEEPEEKNVFDLSNLEINLQKILKEQENIKKLIPKNSGNTIINNKLSINVFLNTECKEAMSIQDFLNQLNLSFEDLYYTKKNGFVEGISNVFVKKLVVAPTHQ